MKKIISYLLSFSVGKAKAYKFYNALYKISLTGLNYGNLDNFEESGETDVLDYIKGKLSEISHVVIFDVGSNVGKYTEKLNLAFGSKATIFAFEPSKNTFKEFLLRTSGLPNIVYNNIALSSQNGESLLYLDIQESDLASLYKRDLQHLNKAYSSFERVVLKTLDSYCLESDIEEIHFLKIDAEGHELDILKGAKEMIALGKIKFIQFEFGGSNIDSRVFFKDFFKLLSKQYILYRVMKGGMIEIYEYSEQLEVFVGANYIASLKSS